MSAEPTSLPPEAAPTSPNRSPSLLRLLFWEGPSFFSIVRDAYFTFDRRTLGFTRILLGFLLLTDLLRRTPTWMEMFSTEGVLPTPLNLERTRYVFSILNAFSTRPELVALWFAIFATYACVLLGYKTKLAQVLTVVWVTGMNGRVLLIENGGYVVFNLLTMWTAFLPMGDRFSLDAMIASMRSKRERTASALNDRGDLVSADRLRPHVTVIGLIILLQLTAIYFFNWRHKTGPAWTTEYSAVYYVLYTDRMVTPIVAQVRDHLPFWLLKGMAFAVIKLEKVMIFFLLLPAPKRWLRLVAFASVQVLHLGFGSTFVLGPFAWSLCVWSTLLFCAEHWDFAARTMKRPERARDVLFDPKGPGALLVCRILARLDRFELLRFEEAPSLATGVAVKMQNGTSATGALAAREIVRALPLGVTIAWTLTLPGVRSLVDAGLRGFESGAISRFFGIRAPGEPEDLEPSRVRRRARKVLAILRELGALAMFAGGVNQALMELWVTKDKWPKLVSELNEEPFLKDRKIRLVPQPEPLRLLSHKLRFLQGWFMFSPNPVMDDGTVIVDAVTADGRHIDPFTGREPDFDLASVKSYGYNQIWCDYFNRIHLPSNTAYRDALRTYLLRYHERVGRPADRIVSGDVYWIEENNPRWNDPSRKGFGYKKNKLFSFDETRVIGAAKAVNE